MFTRRLRNVDTLFLLFTASSTFFTPHTFLVQNFEISSMKP